MSIKILQDRSKDFGLNKGVQLMLKKSKKSMSNINDGVAFILRGAKKRRSMAIASAKMINSDIGISAKLVALK